MSEQYNPDVLSCLANLSNDEVFTPPKVVNDMLDLLPREVFESSKTTFLDIGCKSGVFLREIAKRLIAGLEREIPDLQTRVDHILHHQLYGIATTELTSLVSRRTLYCSKYPNCRYSASRFETPEGNIRFRNIPHEFVNGRCKWCGASEDQFGADKRKGRETHAYEFIHTTTPKEIFNMKFDVIVGNPPYQLGRAIENQNERNASFASAIYPKFIQKATMLHPRHLVMIVPSRWMTKTGQGVPVKWCEDMIQSNHFVSIDDFQDASECFPGVEIKGGVCYFHYSENYSGKCKYTVHQGNEKRTVTDYLDSLGAGVVIRDPIARDIIDKIVAVEGEYYKGSSFSRLVGPVHLFDKDGKLGTKWTDFGLKKDASHAIKYYLNKRVVDSGYAWIRKTDIPKGYESVPLHKVYISEAYGAGEGFPHQILGIPFYGEPNSVCSETYLAIGYNHQLDKKACDNIIKYIKTRFFRFMVYVKKRTQHAVAAVYQFVPMQDFSKPWTDEELYAKYKLTKDEIAFIESMIKPME